MPGTAYIGISGWRYGPWRGQFYPVGLPQRQELEYAAERMNSVELNGSFYSLQRPESFERWAAATSDSFVFSVKGGRYITHMLRLRAVENALGNFFGSGVLALGAKLGPVLWQLPERVEFDAQVLGNFLAQLPRTTAAAVEVARRHDEKLKREPWIAIDIDRPLRHALEVRHPSFDDPACFALLREYGVSLVVADTAGRWPLLTEVTADFVYVRLHGDEELYVSGYGDSVLDRWANDVRGWLGRGLDVYVYFDNDVKVHAPFDAIALSHRVRGTGPTVDLTVRRTS